MGVIMEIELSISELFEAVSELEDISFECEKEYNQKSQIKIKDENGKYQNVPFLMTKEDVLIRIEFDDGSKIETAKKHRLAYNRKDCKFVDDFNIGDVVEKANGVAVRIVSIENILVGGVEGSTPISETVYDLNIDTSTHLYQDYQGFIHHNTAHMGQVADNLGLHFIHIDVSTLTRESTTGIPKASQAKDDQGKPIVDHNGNPVMTTQFSKPELLDLIEKKMKEAVAEDDVFPPEERKKGKGKYKFLLLLDELTRADAQVFNSIRKLLLEKSFNEEFDLPAEIMVVGALNPEDRGVGELTKHTRDVVDVIPARASWAKTESYLLSSERPDGLEAALGFDCNGATVGAIKNILSHFQSKDVDWRGNAVFKEERLFNLRDGGDVIYLSPREITDIVSMVNANILNRLTKVGIRSTLSVKVDSTVNDLSDDDFINSMMDQANASDSEKQADEAKNGIFNKQTKYSEEDFDAFIDAIIVELRDVWASKLSFTCKKQEIDPANFLSVTTGFIMKNNLVRDQYEAIKTQKVEGVKTIGEMFEAYWDDPKELYDSPHFDNYLAANFGAPQKFVQEITDFVGDKVSDLHKGDNSGTVDVVNAKGEKVKMPKLTAKTFEAYLKYLQYMNVILSVLTEKSNYAGQVKEAERTGQYLSNLYTSLQNTGREFLINHKLSEYFAFPDKMDDKLIGKLRKEASEVKAILGKFGLTGSKK